MSQNVIDPRFVTHGSEHKGSAFAHFCGVSIHHIKRRADMRGKIGFVNHENVGAGQRRPSLAGDFFACCHVYHVKRHIGLNGAECCGQVVATAFDEHDFHIRVAFDHLGHGGEID